MEKFTLQMKVAAIRVINFCMVPDNLQFIFDLIDLIGNFLS